MHIALKFQDSKLELSMLLKIRGIMQQNMNEDGADGCVEVQSLTRLELAARSGTVMQKQNLTAISTPTLVRKVSSLLLPYTAPDLWDGVRQGILVESEIIWW